MQTRNSFNNILFIGAGFVGTHYTGGPTAAIIAYHNPKINVVVLDKSESRIEAWKAHSRHLPIYEPGLQHFVRIARDGGRTFIFNDLAGTKEESDCADSSSLDIKESDSRYATISPEHIAKRPKKMVRVPSRQPNLTFTTADDMQECMRKADVIFIAVGGATQIPHSRTDLLAVESAAKSIARYARAGTVIVEKSTVPCRTADHIRHILEEKRPGKHFEILSNPEFLAAGTAIQNLLSPDRILIGAHATPSGRRAAEALAAVYTAWVPRERILMTNVWSSELSKLVSNAMLAQRISSINSIAAICEATGADVEEVATAVGLDPRIGNQFLKAGIGFGGSCLTKDIMILIYVARTWCLEEVAKYWTQVIKINEYQRERYAKRVVRCLKNRRLTNKIPGKKVTLLGFPFKANTSDVRSSPALEILRVLLDANPSQIVVFIDQRCCNDLDVEKELRAALVDFDGRWREIDFFVETNVYDACDKSDALLVITDQEEFRTAGPPQLQSIAYPPIPSTSSGSQPQDVKIKVEGEGEAEAEEAVPEEPSDPRPFGRSKVTESDILALHRYLVRSWPVPVSPCPYPFSSDISEGEDEDEDDETVDPLGRYVPEKQCKYGCEECERVWQGASDAQDSYWGGRVNWGRIATHMNEPKWLFDGRGILDPERMKEFGFRIVSVGRRAEGF
ncbi:nucleotide sugar dehydrogenase [Astrocystis sublimbata]|nr:nucleotide sugar dehydrogenase [Astrocystis sublimbata]